MLATVRIQPKAAKKCKRRAAVVVIPAARTEKVVTHETDTPTPSIEVVRAISPYTGRVYATKSRVVPRKVKQSETQTKSTKEEKAPKDEHEETEITASGINGEAPVTSTTTATMASVGQAMDLPATSGAIENCPKSPMALSATSVHTDQHVFPPKVVEERAPAEKIPEIESDIKSVVVADLTKSQERLDSEGKC